MKTKVRVIDRKSLEKAMGLYAKAKNSLEFEKAKALLVNALEELWLSEDLSLTNIL